MIDEIVSSFQTHQDIFLSPDKALELVNSLSFIINEEELKDGRVKRLPYKISSGDAIGDYLFIALTPLDCSISLALDFRSSMSPIIAMNMSRMFSLSKDSLVICKIDKKQISYDDFKTVALINGGIPGFRSKCVSISCKNSSSYDELKRFTKNRGYGIDISMYSKQDLDKVHKFSFNINGKNITKEGASIHSVLKKIADSDDVDIDIFENPINLAKSLVSVDFNDGNFSKMRKYTPGGNKNVNVGSKVVAKPSNMLRSKCVGTIIGKKRNLIKVKWDVGSFFYDLNNPKTYFLIEIID